MYPSIWPHKNKIIEMFETKTPIYPNFNEGWEARLHCYVSARLARPDDFEDLNKAFEIAFQVNNLMRRMYIGKQKNFLRVAPLTQEQAFLLYLKESNLDPKDVIDLTTGLHMEDISVTHRRTGQIQLIKNYYPDVWMHHRDADKLLYDIDY